MRKFNTTEQPKIRSGLLLSADDQTKDLYKQIQEMHGVGIVLQTADGGTVPVRVNKSGVSLEAFVDGRWQSMGGGSAPSLTPSASSGSASVVSGVDALHNHTGGRGRPVPTDGLVDGAVTPSKLDRAYATLGDIITDHGALSGLGDDDHAQYVLSAGDTMTGGLTIDGSADEVQLVIEGNGTQTSPVLRVQNSAHVSLFEFTNDGLLGIGGTPEYAVDIYSDAGGPKVRATYSTGATVFQGRACRGTVANPTALLSGDTVAAFNCGGWDGDSWAGGGAMMAFKAAEDFDNSHSGILIEFSAVPVGSTGARQTLCDFYSDRIEMMNGKNFKFGTTTGTQIGTAVGQKIAFHGATPVVQANHIANPTGGSFVDTQARTAINAILLVLENKGFTAMS